MLSSISHTSGRFRFDFFRSHVPLILVKHHLTTVGHFGARFSICSVHASPPTDKKPQDKLTFRRRFGFGKVEKV